MNQVQKKRRLITQSSHKLKSYGQQRCALPRLCFPGYILQRCCRIAASARLPVAGQPVL